MTALYLLLAVVLVVLKVAFIVYLLRLMVNLVRTDLLFVLGKAPDHRFTRTKMQRHTDKAFAAMVSVYHRES